MTNSLSSPEVRDARQLETPTHIVSDANLASPDSAKAIRQMKPKETVPQEFGNLLLTDYTADKGADEQAKNAIADVISQNDSRRRDLVTADAPFHSPDGLAGGKYGHSDRIVPESTGGFGEWGVIYPELGKTPDRNTKIQVSEPAIYYHKKEGGWVKAMSPDDAKWWGGNYLANFRDNISTHGDGVVQPDGSFRFSAPPEGKNDHFGPGHTPLGFDPAKYDGVYTTMSVKADRKDSGLVMQLGGDYYLEKPAPGQVSNPAAGGNNWTRLTDDWQRLHFTSLDSATFTNDPPPGLMETPSNAGSPTEVAVPSGNASSEGLGQADSAGSDNPEREQSTNAEPDTSDGSYERSAYSPESPDSSNDEGGAAPMFGSNGNISLLDLLKSLLSADVDGNGILSPDELSRFLHLLDANLDENSPAAESGGEGSMPSMPAGDGAEGEQPRASDQGDAAAADHPSAGAPQDMTSGTFKTSGEQIIGPDGQPFVAKGIAMYGWDAKNPKYLSLVADQLKPNIVRLAAHPEQDSPQDIQKSIDYLTSRGIVVEVEDHTGYFRTSKDGSNMPSQEQLGKVANWYAEIARANVNNPRVWFGTPNEPSGNTQAIVNEEKTIYNAIRGTGNQSIVMLQKNYHGPQFIKDNPAVFGQMENVVLDAHYYLKTKDTDASLSWALKQDRSMGMPLIIGEFGNYDYGSWTENSVKSILKANQSSAVGAIAWNLRNDRGDKKLSGAGADVVYDNFGRLTPYGNEIASWLHSQT